MVSWLCENGQVLWHPLYDSCQVPNKSLASVREFNEPTPVANVPLTIQTPQNINECILFAYNISKLNSDMDGDILEKDTIKLKISPILVSANDVSRRTSDEGYNEKEGSKEAIEVSDTFGTDPVEYVVRITKTL
ncbi:hypothetical protein PoB_000539100 [Plakobranchus ocellatus]|uniref:Uncharacterized protein n=1 Tax=Plakobranchus ocellatus TaxID=259542 RepID=A0AAV3Y6P3_9GAST|nr:hypothetical protein PoB_000539100 [Plakobranchus ocellatus]